MKRVCLDCGKRFSPRFATVRRCLACQRSARNAQPEPEKGTERKRRSKADTFVAVQERGDVETFAPKP